jgi:hypothetical protein
VPAFLLSRLQTALGCVVARSSSTISELNLDGDALLGTTLVHGGDEMANGCICSLSSPRSSRRSFLNRRAAAADRGAQRLTPTTRALTARKRCRNNNTTADATTVCPLPAQRPLQKNIPAFVGQHLNSRSRPSRVLRTPNGERGTARRHLGTHGSTGECFADPLRPWPQLERGKEDEERITDDGKDEDGDGDGSEERAAATSTDATDEKQLALPLRIELPSHISS